MISRNPKDLLPELRERWEYLERMWAEKYPGLPEPFLTCTFRSRNEQKRLVKEGKSKAGPGQSLHNYMPALAFDVAFKRPNGSLDWSFDLFAKFGHMAEKLGLEWGGRWPELVDGPHVQMPMTWKQARAGQIPRLPTLPGDVPTYRVMDADKNKQVGVVKGRIVGDKFYVKELELNHRKIL